MPRYCVAPVPRQAPLRTMIQGGREGLRLWYLNEMSAAPLAAEGRSAARARAEVRIFRIGEHEAEADADALFWDGIPSTSAPSSFGS